MNNYLRHQLIYLKKEAVFEVIDHDKRKYVKSWTQQSLPFIYTRQPQQSSFIHLGLTTSQKKRIGVFVDEKMIEKSMPLPLFNEVFKIQNSDYKNIHVYGSFLFDYLGFPFVQQASDLDILMIYEQTSLLDIKALVQELHYITHRIIDGEIRFYKEKNAMDISIKELLTDSVTLLVKTVSDIHLLSREELYATYPALCER